MVRFPPRWTAQDASELYDIPAWGKGYFSVNSAGHVAVHPYKDDRASIDLKELVDELRTEGVELPLLIRFTDVLRHRVAEINAAFQRAIRENDYRGGYCGVYPIKVNQQRQVVEDLLDCSREYEFGLECGSKPELLAVLALAPRADVPIICNGFKDESYIEMAVLAQKIGKRVIPVVESYAEAEMILRKARRSDVRPVFGVRTKLSARGAGRWKSSTGDRSKFGLTATQLLRLVRHLGENGMADCLRLLHFHIGSQITNIYNLKNAITEAARIYVELTRAGAGLEMIDVGGGLGIDYDGSQTNFESSVNYSLTEYAGDVVARVGAVCDETGVRHPLIISESGRALVAYHSVLVTNVLSVSRCLPAAREGGDPPEETDAVDESSVATAPQPVQELHAIPNEVSSRNVIECYHDAVQYYEEAINTFNLGYLSLGQRALSERLYYRALQRILRVARTLPTTPEELEGIEDQLSDTYFCNFSVFQSLPDSWAVGQLFPVLPIHRLGERPDRRGVLADLTCDSDGKVDRFIHRRDVKRSLELHPFHGGEYYLGVFLVGAYQEILGDLHNLFGDTNSVHVQLRERDGSGLGNVNIDTVVDGDTVEQVLSYVQYSGVELVRRIRADVEAAKRQGQITPAEARRFVDFYKLSLAACTYLTSDSSAPRTGESRSAAEPPVSSDREASPSGNEPPGASSPPRAAPASRPS